MMTIKYETTKERDLRVYDFFQSRLAAGDNKTRATYAAMEKFGFTAPITMRNIRKRVEKRMQEKGIEK